MSKHHRLQTRKSDAATKPMPLNFLLGCSQDAIGEFELARLAEVANLRTELHATLDRMIDSAAQAALAGWFRTISREDLKRRVLQSPDEAYEEIMTEAREEIRNQGRSHEEADTYGKMPMPDLFRPSLPPGAAHLAASLRYQERNIAAGKCRYWPKPLERNSVDMCTKHLALKREQDRRDNHRRGKRGNPNLEPGTREYLYGAEEVPLSTHGQQPGTLESLAVHREQRKRAFLAKLGIKPERTAATLNVVMEILLKLIPDKAHAMTQAELFEKAGGISNTTGQKALKALLEEKKIQRIGAGGVREPYRYFLKR